MSVLRRKELTFGHFPALPAPVGGVAVLRVRVAAMFVLVPRILLVLLDLVLQTLGDRLSLALSRLDFSQRFVAGSPESFLAALGDPASHALNERQHHEEGVGTDAHLEFGGHILPVGGQVGYGEPLARLDLVPGARLELGVARDVADDVEAHDLVVDQRFDVVLLVDQAGDVETGFFKYLTSKLEV